MSARECTEMSADTESFKSADTDTETDNFLSLTSTHFVADVLANGYSFYHWALYINIDRD
jgi:hypothetical protein